ncbi:sulfatase family protein [Rubripirellula reticaptiva]|nr:sulfatase-like hydrolase/transferase [Rubripirellula reticaptiva]
MKMKPLLIAYVLMAVATAIQAAERPNILLIVSDDQGYNDLGELGNGIITPALDRLSREGTRLTNFYVSWPACTPSRASLLTGRYPQRNGIYDMIRNEAPDYGHKYSPDEYAVTFERIGGMDEREVIIPAVLKPVGYKSGIYGKWDLGALKRFLPTSRGFDDFYGFVNTGIDYFTHQRYGVPCMVRNLSPTDTDKGTYCTYLFQREAVRFLGEHANKKPFFLYVPFNAPHNSSALDPTTRSSVQAPDKFKEMYPPVDAETKIATKYRYGTPATLATADARRRDYRAAVTCMDAAITEMLNMLDQKQILDDTIVIFFSDNGGSGGADNSPLRGHKGQTWEGGIRVPCIVRWPNGGVRAGAINNAFLSSLELMPSLASAAGAELPTDIALDGFDWWPTLRGETTSPRKEMFWKRRDQLGARIGKWKWVKMGDAGGLFDLETDIKEQNDLSESRPKILEMVKAHYADWLNEMEAAEPRGPFRDF